MIGVKPRGLIANGSAYTAGDDGLAANLTARFHGRVRIAGAVSAAAVVYFRHNSVNLNYNRNVPEGANDLFAYEFPVRKGDVYNIRFSASVTVRKLTVDEIYEEG